MVSLIFHSSLSARASQPGEQQKCHQIIRSLAWCQKSVEEGEDIFLSSLPAPLPCQGFWSWPQGRACIFSPGSKFQDICHSEGRWQLLGEVLRVENVGLPAQPEAWPSHQQRAEKRSTGFPGHLYYRGTRKTHWSASFTCLTCCAYLLGFCHLTTK